MPTEELYIYIFISRSLYRYSTAPVFEEQGNKAPSSSVSKASAGSLRSLVFSSLWTPGAENICQPCEPPTRTKAEHLKQVFHSGTSGFCQAFGRQHIPYIGTQPKVEESTHEDSKKLRLCEVQQGFTLFWLSCKSMNLFSKTCPVTKQTWDIYAPCINLDPVCYFEAAQLWKKFQSLWWCWVLCCEQLLLSSPVAWLTRRAQECHLFRTASHHSWHTLLRLAKNNHFEQRLVPTNTLSILYFRSSGDDTFFSLSEQCLFSSLEFTKIHQFFSVRSPLISNITKHWEKNFPPFPTISSLQGLLIHLMQIDGPCRTFNLHPFLPSAVKSPVANRHFERSMGKLQTPQQQKHSNCM